MLELVSGDEVLLGGKVVGLRALVTAESDVRLEGDVILAHQITPFADAIVESLAGNVLIGPKIKIQVSRALLSAAAGGVTFFDRVVVRGRSAWSEGSVAEINASGTVELTSPKFSMIGEFPVVSIRGGTVLIHKKASMKASGPVKKFAGSSRVEIVATVGDVSIDRISVDTSTRFAISGTNVTIGVAQNGKVPRSKMINQGEPGTSGLFNILATDSIQIRKLRLNSASDVRIDSSGTTVNVLESSFKGRQGTPTFEVEGGPGSTCDLTGTTVKKATLVTNCDTVIGP